MAMVLNISLEGCQILFYVFYFHPLMNQVSHINTKVGGTDFDQPPAIILNVA